MVDNVWQSFSTHQIVQKTKTKTKQGRKVVKEIMVTKVNNGDKKNQLLPKIPTITDNYLQLHNYL